MIKQGGVTSDIKYRNIGTTCSKLIIWLFLWKHIIEGGEKKKYRLSNGIKDNDTGFVSLGFFIRNNHKCLKRQVYYVT